MDIKDLKKADVGNADEITIKEIEIKDKKKGREIEIEEIKIRRTEKRKETLNKFKKFLSKFWQIVWKDDSPKGWLISIIFIFVIIKFIFFPVLSLATGTSLPLAIVESCSMYHDGNLLSNFDNWWENHESKYSALDITSFDFGKFTKGLNKGDILFIMEAKPEKLEIGDVIIFNGGTNNPIIHRIIKIEKQDDEYIFSTIGDNNNGQLNFEKNIKENQLIGKATFKIAPSLGWGKLIFYEPFRAQNERGFCDEN